MITAVKGSYAYRASDDPFVQPVLPIVPKVVMCLNGDVPRDQTYAKASTKYVSHFTPGNVYVASRMPSGKYCIENDRDSTIIILAETLESHFMEVIDE